MIGVYFIENHDIRSDELEYEHDAVTFIEVQFFKVLNCRTYLYLLLCLLLYLFNIYFYSFENTILITKFFMHFILVYLNLNFSIVKFFVVLQVKLRSQHIFQHLIFSNQRMTIDLFPGDSLPRVNCQALLDEIHGVFADVDPLEIWTSFLYFLKNFIFSIRLKRVLAIQ